MWRQKLQFDFKNQKEDGVNSVVYRTRTDHACSDVIMTARPHSFSWDHYSNVQQCLNIAILKLKDFQLNNRLVSYLKFDASGKCIEKMKSVYQAGATWMKTAAIARRTQPLVLRFRAVFFCFVFYAHFKMANAN